MSHSSLIVLITGATAGIGRHAAVHLAARGHRVIATGRNRAALDALRAENPGRIDVLALDVTDAEAIAKAVASVTELTGGRGIDALVNNAGYGMLGPLSEMTDGDVRAQFDTNVFGLLAVTRAFLPGMMANGRGRVVNVSSLGGRATSPFFGAYCATKFAVEAMSDALRVEVAPFGIHVSLIEPGPIHSNFAERSMQGIQKYRSTTSPYAAVYARADALRAQTDANSFGPEFTSRAIERALTDRWPSARYVAPGRLAVVLWLANRLPTRWVDALLARAFGLTSKGLRRGALPATAT